jgi:hypothetical protein
MPFNNSESKYFHVIIFSWIMNKRGKMKAGTEDITDTILYSFLFLIFLGVYLLKAQTQYCKR